MSPEQHARHVVAEMCYSDPADAGLVPASVIHAVLVYALKHCFEFERLGDYGLRRLADALVNELGIPPGTNRESA